MLRYGERFGTTLQTTTTACFIWSEYRLSILKITYYFYNFVNGFSENATIHNFIPILFTDVAKFESIR